MIYNNKRDAFSQNISLLSIYLPIDRSLNNRYFPALSFVESSNCYTIVNFCYIGIISTILRSVNLFYGFFILFIRHLSSFFDILLPIFYIIELFFNYFVTFLQIRSSIIIILTIHNYSKNIFIYFILCVDKFKKIGYILITVIITVIDLRIVFI